MAEGFINFTEGSGKKLRTFNRTIGANSVEEQFVNFGAQSVATYFALGSNVSVATANDHLLQLMAGASLNVRVHKITVFQGTNVTTAAVGSIELWRLTTAGTGGGAVTPAKNDNGDAASGATAMTLPTAKGTEATQVTRQTFNAQQTSGASPSSDKIIFSWEQSPWGKPIIIPAGTANGLALKSTAALAAGTCNVRIEFSETSYL